MGEVASEQTKLAETAMTGRVELNKKAVLTKKSL